MAGTNEDAERSSSVRNAGSRLVWGEGVHSAHGNPPRDGRWWPGEEKLSMDSDCTRLRRSSGMSKRLAVVSG